MEQDKVVGEALAPAQPPVFWQLTGSAIAPVAELARQASARVEFLEIPAEALPVSALLGAPHLSVRVGADGKPEVQSLKAEIDAYRTKPAFREGTATATTAHSFTDLVNRHANADTAIFVDANWRAPKLTAVIDYHAIAAEAPDHGADHLGRESSADGEDPHARFGRHRIVYAFPLSEPWKIWTASDGMFMTQADFAQFIEDHVHELASPLPNGQDETLWRDLFKTTIASPSDMVDLARGLDIKVGAAVKNRVRLATGETSFQFETVHTDSEGRELTVPGLFILSVPIFYRDEAARIPVRLRYRVQNGAITWAYQMHRPDEFVDNTVRENVDQIAANTGLPVYDGAPEAK